MFTHGRNEITYFTYKNLSATHMLATSQGYMFTQKLPSFRNDNQTWIFLCSCAPIDFIDLDFDVVNTRFFIRVFKADRQLIDYRLKMFKYSQNSQNDNMP
jgi:hypothetical protein